MFLAAALVLIAIVALYSLWFMLRNRPFNYRAATACIAVSLTLVVVQVLVDLDRPPRIGGLLLMALTWIVGVVGPYMVLRAVSESFEGSEK